MTALVLVASLTLLASFLCSLFEAALYAITPGEVELLVDRGGRGAERIARMREDIEEPIAAILTVNTIAHTVGSAWCGAMVGEEFGSAAVGVFAAIFTLLVLAFTEIIPKSLGVRHAATLAPTISFPLQLMIWSVFPIVWVAKRAMALFGGGHVSNGPSEDEIVVLSRLAARGGGVRREEHRWVANALRLDTVKAGDLRTPRTVVETLPADMPVRDITSPDQLSHSRIPITAPGNRDEVVGLVHRREVFDAALERPDAALVLGDLSRPLRFIPESMAAHELLQQFLATRSHMAAVAGEFGDFRGVVTLEDVLECLLGAEIVDEHDRVEDMRALALQRCQERLALQEAEHAEASAAADAARDPELQASTGELPTVGAVPPEGAVPDGGAPDAAPDDAQPPAGDDTPPAEGTPPAPR